MKMSSSATTTHRSQLGHVEQDLPLILSVEFAHRRIAAVMRSRWPAQRAARASGSSSGRWWLTVVTSTTCCAVCGGVLRNGCDMVYRHTPREARCTSCAEGLSYRPSARWEWRKRREVQQRAEKVRVSVRRVTSHDRAARARPRRGDARRLRQRRSIVVTGPRRAQQGRRQRTRRVRRRSPNAPSPTVRL
jgi:hypothetical protein